MISKPRHASFREVADLVDGSLSGARLERVQSHLSAGCPSCDATLERARGLVSALTAGPLPPPPAAVRRRAASLYGAAWRRRALKRARDVLASLVVDQRLAPATALRGGAGTARRLLWTVPGVEIVVSVVAQGRTHDILGQILPDDDTDEAAPSGDVELLVEGKRVALVPLDAEGGFARRGLLAGTYVLRGRADGLSFRTPPFVVG